MLKKLFHILFITTFFTSCNSQIANPKSLGKRILDLDKITFDENIDTLFSKVKHRKLPITDGYYDKEKKKTVTTDTLAFDIRISKKTPNQPLFYFLDKNFTEDYLVSIYTDKKNNFRAFSFSDFRKEPYDNILKKYRRSMVNIRLN